MKTLYISVFLFVKICIMADCFAQTLSNMQVLQGRRSEAGVSDVSSFYSEKDASKFLPTWKRATVVQPGPITDAIKKGRKDGELEKWKQATKYARDNASQFARRVELYSKFRDIYDIDPEAKEPEVFSIAYASLALQDKSTLDKYFKDNGIDEGDEIRSAIDAEISAMRGYIAKISSPTIVVFASGNIRGAATSNSTEPTRSGTGTIGAVYASNKHVFSAQFSVASTVDTIKGSFGSNILIPLNGKSLKSAAIEWLPKLRGNNSYLHTYANFASSLWEIDSITFKNASVLGIGILYHRKFFDGFIGETGVGLDGEIGLSSRFVDGDVRNLLKESAGESKYLAAFPTKRAAFPGLEAGLTLNFGQIVAGLQAYYLVWKKGESIDGLTRFQISVGLSVRGDVIRGFLGKRE